MKTFTFKATFRISRKPDSEQYTISLLKEDKNYGYSYYVRTPQIIINKITKAPKLTPVEHHTPILPLYKNTPYKFGNMVYF